MPGREVLREQQRTNAEAIRRTAERLGTTADPKRAREARDVIVSNADRIVELVDVLAKEGG